MRRDVSSGARHGTCSSIVMEDAGHIGFYFLLAVLIVLAIFIGALTFVNATRRGNRRFKWGRSPRPPAKS